MNILRPQIARTLQIIALCFYPLAAILQAPTMASAAPPEGFAAPEIRAIWQRDDAQVASGQAKGTWLWGPGPFYTNYEPYLDTPQGNHLVQYFDKGRLEINDPDADPESPWFVTSGLLVREMVSGRAQVGDNSYYSIGPANVHVTGDGDSATPTYATFAGLQAPSQNHQGQPLSALLGKDGKLTQLDRAPASVTFTRYEPATGHNWADVFWSFANSQGRPGNFEWLYTLGYPITEPYWVRAPVNGQETLVLVQLFERRALTFNPANPPASQVEMGNVGRHYYTWRYANMHEAKLDTRYAVSITVGTAPTRTTNVQQLIELTNNTGKPLDRVVLRAAWHHWEGVFTLRSAIAYGKEVPIRWLHGVNLEIPLVQPLPPGARVTLDLTFDLKPRPVGGRTGYDKANDILSLGDALPTVVPWENGGWSFYPYSQLGDLGHYSTSDYTVEIKPAGNEKLVVGGTGRITASQPQSSSWKFSAESVRDVAYVVSPRFINPLSDTSMARKVGKTTMRAYFLPEHRTDGQRQLDLVAPAFAWYEKQIGPYPFDTYTVAEMGVPLEPTDNYAQEYPMAYFVPTSWLRLGTTPGNWTWYIPAHEVGHQWFYSTIGSNQLTNPWLDEAMTTYITAEYVRANFPDQYARSWASMSGAATTTRPVSSGVYSGFESERQYTAAVYDTGVVMLNKVRVVMGDAAFYDALKDYYATFKLKRAAPHDLMVMLQKHSKVDLTGIFAQYLGY
ncbi:MAG TPA: M1 family aminopeptidase [Chloroflexia bacterium]|nr:M1 family aminopeptidase [Chloroflexia bacterium]